MAYKKMTENIARLVKSLPSTLSVKPLKGKVSSWIHHKKEQHEKFVGLTEVKEAQSRVLSSANCFIKSQEDRRKVQKEIHQIQQKINENFDELDQLKKWDVKQLGIIQRAIPLRNEEKLLQDKLKLLEKEERKNFTTLSQNVKDSHEKERAQAEKTMYWSIFASVMGTMVGFLGSTIPNHLRMKKLKELVEQENKNNYIYMNPEELSTQISSAVHQHLQAPQISQDISEGRWKDLKSSLLQTIQLESENQKKSIVELSQHLKASHCLNTVASIDNENTMDVENFFCTTQQNMKNLLDQQAIHKNILLGISVLIPTCSFVLFKFLNP